MYMSLYAKENCPLYPLGDLIAGLDAIEKRKILPVPGIELRAVRLVTRLYTDGAIPAPTDEYNALQYSYYVVVGIPTH
jgi:hypothetical protein